MTDHAAPPSPGSALLTFRASNARSFRDELELSLLSTALADRSVVRRLPWREGGKPVEVLPVAGVFGANASGKSNLLRAMNDMRMYVLNSFRRTSPKAGPPRWPFLLDEDARRQPSRYIVLDGVRHEYGFAIDDSGVVEEWALRYPRGRATAIFRRVGDDVALGPSERSSAKGALGLLRPNALFLSTAAAANHSGLGRLYEWFERHLLLAEVGSRPARQAFTAGMLSDPGLREQVLELLRVADLGIVDAEKRPLDPALRERLEQAARILFGEEDAPDLELPELDELGTHLVHRGPDGAVPMDPECESLGTQVWFGLVGPVIAALRTGATLLADELDATLLGDSASRATACWEGTRSGSRRSSTRGRPGSTRCPISTRARTRRSASATCEAVTGASRSSPRRPLTASRSLSPRATRRVDLRLGASPGRDRRLAVA